MIVEVFPLETRDKIHGQIAIIFFPAESDQDLLSKAVDIPHLLDLVVSFRDVGLVYANGVDPDDDLVSRVPELRQGSVEILSYREPMSIDGNRNGGIEIAPNVGKCPVAWGIPQRGLE
jgi:hypothetical protein